MVEQNAPVEETKVENTGSQSMEELRKDYGFFSTDGYQTVHAPGQAVGSEAPKEPAKKASSTPPAAQPPAPPVPSPEAELPDYLVELAKNVGFEDDEIKSYKGDAKALTATINHLLRNIKTAPTDDDEEEDEDDTPLEAKKGKKADDDFDFEKFVKGEYNNDGDGIYDEGVVRLAKHVKKLEAELATYKEVKEALPHVQQFIHEQRRQQWRSIWEADLKEAGASLEILKDDATLQKGVAMVANLQKAYREMGAAAPKPSELWKAVLPLVGGASSTSPQAVEGQSTGQKKNGSDLSAQQKAALDKARNPMNGQFVAEPVHRGHAPGRFGDPLRDLLVDHAIDPGPEPSKLKKEELGFIK